MLFALTKKFSWRFYLPIVQSLVLNEVYLIRKTLKKDLVLLLVTTELLLSFVDIKVVQFPINVWRCNDLFQTTVHQSM